MYQKPSNSNKLNTLRTFFALFILIVLNGCNPTRTEFTLIYSTDEPIGEISKLLEQILEESFYNVDIILSIGEGSEANLDSVSSGKIDFTITENHVDYVEGVNTVVVFYPQILHIFYSKNYEPQTFQELVNDKTLYIGKEGSGSYRFMMSLFEFFNIDQSRVVLTSNPFDDFDVYVGFTDILTNDKLQGLSDFNLYSFDDPSKIGNGSIVEAISLKYPKVQPFIIPEKTYGEMTDKAIATISSDAVLVCRKDLLDLSIQDMISTIFKEKQLFNNISPLIFKSLTENFDRSRLTYPLHNGARVYLDRDEPSFLERYAELFGVILSIAIALISAIISLSKWQTQKKKDRVDVFYKVLIDIKKELHELKTSHDVFIKIKEIKEAQNKAFEMLINEELVANESFRIFMELSKETIQEVQQRARILKDRESNTSVIS
jgi:TRAP-type uncharacterized transport system substrate-binding protein